MWYLYQAELQLPVSQALALFVKLIRKISTHLTEIQKAAIGATIPTASTSTSTALPSSRVGVAGDGEDAEMEGMGQGMKGLEDELDKAGDEVTSEMKEKQRAMIDALDLSRYVYSILTPNLCGWDSCSCEKSLCGVDTLSTMRRLIGAPLRNRSRVV